MRHAGWLSITGVVIVVALALVVAAVPFVMPSEMFLRTNWRRPSSSPQAISRSPSARSQASRSIVPASPWSAHASWWHRAFCRSGMPTRRSTSTPSPCFSA